MPLFSIVVPIYNVEKYLSLCLDHLRGQSFADFEVICVDDGSTDGSLRVAKMQSDLDSRIRVIQKANGGVSSARNLGLREAKGEYVLFADSDDYLRYNACEVLSSIVRDQHPDIVTFGADCIPSWANYPWLEKCLSPRDAVYDSFDSGILFKESSAPFSWRALFRRSFLIENGIWYKESLPLGEDEVFLFEAYPCSSKTVFSSSKLYCYRLSREGSAMEDLFKDMSGRVEKHLQVVECVLAFWHERGFVELCPRELLSWTLEFTFEDIYRLPIEEQEPAFKSLGKLLWAYFDDAPSVAKAIGPHTAKVVDGLVACSRGGGVSRSIGREYTLSRIGWSGYAHNVILSVLEAFRKERPVDDETLALQDVETCNCEEEAKASLRMLETTHGLLAQNGLS